MTQVEVTQRRRASTYVRAVALVVGSTLLSGCSDGDTRVVVKSPDDHPPRSLCFVSVSDELPQATPEGPPQTTSESTPERTDFSVTSELAGPWRVGVLTYQNGGAWIVAEPGAERQAPKGDGSITATFSVRQSWPNKSLPSLSNASVVESSQPLEVFVDTGSLRAVTAPRRWPVTYTVSTPPLPTVAELETVTVTSTDEFSADLVAPTPTATVRSLLEDFSAGSPWARFDAFRNWVLDNVASVGLGIVVPTGPTRIDEVLRTKRASPFELVALQALGARWLGVPSRLAFGYDGGETAAGLTLDVDTTKHGKFYLEVHFGRLGWVPVVGVPKHADAADCMISAYVRPFPSA